MDSPKLKYIESLKQWFLSDIKHPLLAAARDGDLPNVVEQLDAGDDANCVDTCVTALSLSIVFDRKDVFDHLLNVDNIDVNSIDLGIDSGQVELFPKLNFASDYYMQRLLQCKSLDVNDFDIHGNTAFMNACKQGNDVVCKAILSGRHANTLDMQQANNSGNTPLSIIARYGHIKLAKMFMEEDVLNRVKVLLPEYGELGLTPLQIACDRNQYNFVKRALFDTGICIDMNSDAGQKYLCSLLQYTKSAKLAQLLVPHVQPWYFFQPCFGPIRESISFDGKPVVCIMQILQILEKCFPLAKFWDMTSVEPNDFLSQHKYKIVYRALEFWHGFIGMFLHIHGLFELETHESGMQRPVRELYVKSNWKQTLQEYIGKCVGFLDCVLLRAMFYVVQKEDMLHLLLTKDSFTGIAPLYLAQQSTVLRKTIERELGNLITPAMEESCKHFREWYMQRQYFSSTTYDRSDGVIDAPDRESVRSHLDRIKNKLMAPKSAEYKAEVLEIKTAINDVITYVAEHTARTSKHLSFIPILRGSSREGTRAFYPDEFDYILHCTEMEPYFYYDLTAEDELDYPRNTDVD